MERSFIINVSANTKPAQKAFNQLGAQYEELQDGVIKVKMIYDYADKDSIFNALKDLSASNPELLVQINYDMQESLLKQKLKELSSLKELQSALGDSDPAALQNYINSMIDNIESGLKSGIDKSSISEIFKKAMDLDSLGLEFFGDNWETKATDRLVDVVSKLGRDALEYIPDTEKLTDEFENNLATQVENAEKIIDGIKLQLGDLLSKGARSIGGDIDFTDQAESVENFQKTAEDVNDTLAKTNTIKIFDGVSEQIYSVTDDVDQLMNKLQELAQKMQTPVFHTGDLSDSLLGSNNEFVTDSLGKLLSDGSGLSLGSGKYFTQNLADLIGGWSESGGSFYAFDISNYTDLLKAETDDQLYELSDMFDAITTLIANAAHDGLSTSTILEQIDAKDATGVFEYYKDLLTKLGVSSKQFDEFITEQTSWLKSVIDPSQSIDNIYKSLEPYEGFASKFIKTFTGANGFNASNLGTADSSVLGSVIYAFNKKSSPYIDFGENKDIAKKFYELVIDKIISNKALNPENDLKEIVKIFSAEKYKGDARLSDEKINDLHKKLPELEEIQSEQTLETFEELNGEVLSKRSDISEAATQIREKESQVINAINKKNEELQEISDNLDDTDNKINTVAVNSFQQTDEDNEIISASQQISQRETELIEQLRQKEEELEVAEQKIEDTRSVLEDEIARLNSENSRLQDRDLERMTALSANEQQSEEISNLKGRIEELSKSESELLEKVQAKEKELADANAKLNESTGLYDDAVQQIHQLQDENRGLADESDTFLGKMEELQDQLELADSRIMENHKFYDEQLGKLQETVDTLTKDNNQLIEDNQYWQSESARKQSVIDTLKTENKDIKGQSTTNVFSNEKTEDKISNNESEVFNSIEKAALDAAAAKELFTEENKKLMEQADPSIARLESETKALNDLAEAGLNAAAAKELVTEENVNLGAIIEGVLPNIKAEAEAFDKMGGYDGSKTSSGEKTGSKRKRGITQTDKKNLNKLKETINGSEYLSSIYGSDIEDLENRFANFDKAKDSIDELRDSLSKLKQQVSETAKEQGDAGAQYEKTAKSAQDLYDRIKASQNKNDYTDEYNQHLEELKISLQEIIDAEKNHDASEAWDTDLLDEYKKKIEEIKQEFKGGELTSTDNLMASTGQVDKLLNKVKSDMAGSSLSGSLLADYEKLRSVLEDVRVGGEGAADGVSSITKTQLQNFINEWIRLNGEIKESGQNIKSFQHQFSSALTNQAAQFLAQYFSFRDIIRYGRELAQTVTQTNSALTELKKVSDASNTRIQQSFSRSSETAQELGSTITDVINSTADWARLGYSIDQAEDLARVTQLYQTVGDNMTQETASQSLVSMLQGFQIDASQAERVVDSVNEVANNFAIDTAGIGEALQRSAAAFNASGTDLNKSIALVTTANSVLQNPESVGTIFKTMSARIRGAKTELADLGEEEDEFTQTTSKLRDLIKQLTGFDIMEDENTYKDIYEILLGIGKEWKTLTDIEQASLAESLAGKRGANALFAVLNNTQQLEKAYKSAQGAAGSAAREQENYAQSVQYSIDRARASLEELANDFLSSELLKGLIETANTFLQIVDKIVETLGSGTSIVTAFLGIDAAKGFLGNQGLIANLIKGITDYKTGGTADSILGNLLRMNKSTAVAIGKEAGEAVANGAAVAVGSAAPKVGGILGSGILSGLGPVLAGGAIALLIGGAIYAAYKNYKEDLIKGAKASAEDWNSASISLKDYSDQLTDLRAQLDSENLSESERYQIKQEIYSIQQKITDEYGSQARGVDLINGDLNKQLQILDQISEKEARTNLRENKKEYKEVAKRFEKNYDDIKLQIAPQITDDDTREFAEEMERAMRETGIVKDFYRDIDTGSNIVVEGGDISKLAENADILTKKLYEIKAGYEEIGDVAKASYVESVINEVSAQTGKISDSYKDLADTYNHYVEMQILSKGGRGVLDAASDAVDKYNEALTSGKSEEIDSLRATMQGAINDLNTFANNNGIKIGLAEVGSQVDEVEEKIFNVKNALSENPSNTNPYIDEVTILKKSFDELKDYDFDDIDLLNLINNPTAFDGNLRKMSGELLYMQNALGLSDEELIKIAQDLGVIKTVAADVGDSISTEFNNFKKSIGSTLTTLDSVNAALASAAGGKGLSLSVNEETGALEGDLITIKNAFADLEGFNPADLFRKTANGVKLNEKQLRKLKSQQDKITRSKFLKQQQDLTKKLTEANKQLAAAQNESARSKAQGQIDDIRKQLSELDYLKTAYEGATSAYQKWLDAQSAGERGDIYDNITKTAVSRADELYKAGLVGTNEFRALAELISGQDLSTASVDQVISAYKELDTAIDGTNMTLRNFFSEGQEGCNSFAKALVDLGEASLEDGAIVFDDLDTEELAKKMHTSVDMIEAILEKMNDYGAELTWMTREQADSIKEMSDRAAEAKKNWDKASKGRDDYSSDFNAEELFDLSKVRSVSDLEQKISAIKNILADPATVNMDDSQVAALRELLQICLDLKGELEAPGTSGTLTVDQFKQYEAALSKLKEDIETINKHDGLVVLSDDDREFIDLLLANKNIQKELGIEPTDDAEALMKQLGLDGSSSGLKVELGAARIKPQKTVNRTQENVERRESKITSNEVHNTTTDVHNKEEHTKITVEANADPNVYKVQTILGEFEGTPEEIAKRILVEALGEEEVLALQKAEDGVYDRKVQVIAKAIGTNDVNLLKNSINQVTGRTVGVGINVTGLSQIDTAVRKLQELANAGVRVASKTINIRTAQANGTAHAQGTAFAKGHGNWGLKRDENALINEVGPELVVLLFFLNSNQCHGA